MADPNDPFAVSDLDVDEESIDEKTPTQIYADLLAHGELILTIGAADLKTLREGISSARYKHNRRAEANGLPKDADTIEFDTKASTEFPMAIECHIRRVKRGAIRILKTELPDSSL